MAAGRRDSATYRPTRAKALFGLQQVDKLRCRVGQAGASPGNHIDVTRQIELVNFYFLHPAVIDLPSDAHARHDRHAHAHLHKALDAFDGGHFDGHVERGFVAAEELDDAATEGRFDAVRHKTLAPEVGDVHLLAPGQRMFGMHHQRKFVLEYFRGLQLRVAGNKGYGAQIESIVQNLVRDVAREHAVNADLHARVGPPELGKGGQKGMNRAFVDTERKLAAGEAFQFGKPLFYLVAEIDEALGVVAQQVTGVSKPYRPRAARKKRLTEAVFQLAD